MALGCNDKGAWSSCREALEAALARFRCEGIDVVARSAWWSSLAWPDPTDPPFLNGVVIVRTEHDPHALMAALGRIEEAFGRQRTHLNAPRTLDLDLLLHDAQSIDTPRLSLPHPRTHLRAFVLVPLCEIAPDCRIPGRGKAAAWLPAVRMQGIEKIMPTLDADKRSETFP